MKNKLSFIACLFIILVLVNERTKHSELRGKPEIKVTTWDALGYYMYLPAIFIYDDYKELKWFQAIDSTYSLSGGDRKSVV